MWGNALLHVKQRRVDEDTESLIQLKRQVFKFKAEQARRLEYDENWGESLINVKQKKIESVIQSIAQTKRMMMKIVKEQERRLLL